MASRRYFKFYADSIAKSQSEITESKRKLGTRAQVAAGANLKRIKGCQMLNPEQGSVRNPCNLNPCIVMITFLGAKYKFCSPSHALIWLAQKVEEMNIANIREVQQQARITL